MKVSEVNDDDSIKYCCLLGCCPVQSCATDFTVVLEVEGGCVQSPVTTVLWAVASCSLV